MEKDGRRHIGWCLDGRNYESWKFGMKLALQSDELWGIVDGTEQKPDVTLKRLTARLITLDKSMRNDEEKRSTPDAAFLSKNKNGAEPHDEESRECALPAQFDRGKRGHSSHQQSGATKECWECKSTTHVRAQCRQYKRRREKEEDEADRKRKRFDRNDRRDSNRSRDQRDKDRHRRDDSRDEKDYQKERKGYSYTSSTDRKMPESLLDEQIPTDQPDVNMGADDGASQPNDPVIDGLGEAESNETNGETEDEFFHGFEPVADPHLDIEHRLISPKRKFMAN
ncbi:hypothetical protein DAPPUDRAFT_104652 [Daphnia pulex]|uniref:Retrotransposon Copia-like N-terminal domain-containing protein n=1 Tax=Daphnia pulex TaxID=6669 RepID=E9GMX3_DAPPU|nr:hypothetical protein DAPPUDRAFT_104652 [Daphnia pulex]|eukprot:EFX79168.1 hypothetical protein DAPPUDRAFT_104652 [Daphnia pulex]